MNDKLHQEEKLFPEFETVSTQEWENLIIKDLEGQDYEKKLVWQQHDGIKVKPYYRKEDLDNLNYLISEPGNYPFIRSNRKVNSWKSKLDVQVDSISAANQFALALIKNGADAICFNMSRLATVAVLNQLLSGINPENTSIYFAKSDCFRDQINFYIEFLEENNYNLKNISGALDVDPYANLMVNGVFPDSYEKVKLRLKSIQEIVIKSLPLYKSLNIRAHIYHNSGATAAQEIAFSLAQANEYLVLFKELNFDTDEILKKIQFTYAVGSDYFIEIAKLRAARLLWTVITSEYHPQNIDNSKMIINAVTSTWNKSLYDPYTNMLRLTTESMSAIIGGTEVLTVQPFDFLYKKQNEFSAINGLHIQNLLKEESKLDKVTDPGAGSYYIEKLTDLIAEKAWDLFRKVESAGGFLEAAKKNLIQSEIKSVADQKNKEVLIRKDKILGLNIFPDIHEKIVEDIELDIHDNPILEDSMVKPLNINRKAKVFEQIRLNTENFAKQGGKLPKVFIFPIGNPAMSSARSMFVRNFFGCSGFEIIENNRFNDADEGVEVVGTNNPDMVVLCCADSELKEYVAKIYCKLKNARLKPKLMVAGYPPDLIKNLQEQGVTEFIHIKSDIVETIKKYQKHFGII